MSINDQIATYAAVIAAMLTLLRIISGITGSQTIRKSILLSATVSVLALTGATVALLALEISVVKDYIHAHRQAAALLSNGWFSIWFVVVIYNFGLGVILRLYVRSLRFKDWGTIRNLKAVFPCTFIRSVWRLVRGDRKQYETAVLGDGHGPDCDSLMEEYFGKAAVKRRTLLLTGEEPWALRKRLLDLIVRLITETEVEINYVCCSVSPANIWRSLEDQCPQEILAKLKRRLVFVDAYTETFGFGDDVIMERIREMTVDKSIEIVSCNSAAGVHSGTATAFKTLKKLAKADRRERSHCTMIYDTLSVLAIPETESEVAEFVIHLAAAELAYDMLTIFVEADIEHRESDSINAMRACCGSPITLTGDKE